MSQIFNCRQTNDINFRAQVFKNTTKYVLWVAESKDDVYTITFKNVLAADCYREKDDDSERVLLLYRDEEEDVQTVEVGLFNHEDAIKFIQWMESSVKNIGSK
jgi:hypothetical protein